MVHVASADGSRTDGLVSSSVVPLFFPSSSKIGTSNDVRTLFREYTRDLRCKQSKLDARSTTMILVDYRYNDSHNRMRP
jgi:hypothetical protein